MRNRVLYIIFLLQEGIEKKGAGGRWEAGGSDTSQFVSGGSEQLKAVLWTPPVVSRAQKKVISFQSWDKIDTLPSTKTSYFSINIFLDGTAYLSPVAMVEGMKGGHSGTITSDETAGGKADGRKITITRQSHGCFRNPPAWKCSGYVLAPNEKGVERVHWFWIFCLLRSITIGLKLDKHRCSVMIFLQQCRGGTRTMYWKEVETKLPLCASNYCAF